MAPVNELLAFLKDKQVITDKTTCDLYAADWVKHYETVATAVLFPETTEQVQQIVLWARKNKVALVPSGGRTGLSGGASALNGEVIVSLERMNKILSYDPIDKIVTVEAGVITEELQKFAKENKCFFPIDFAAKGSSQIGGNVATNAGGIKVVRYGLTRDYVMGLEVVTGEGEILKLNKSLIKNATGPDLRHLFIGSEGIFGFITKVELKLISEQKESVVLILGTDSLNKAMTIFKHFRDAYTINAFEFFSDIALKHVLAEGHTRKPFDTECPFYTLIEIENHDNLELPRILESFEKCMTDELILDGTISQTPTQAKELWRLREDISEALRIYSPYKNDISVRVSKVPAFVQEIDSLLKSQYPDFEVVWFGHIGDGNLHINVLKPQTLAKEEFVKKCKDVTSLLLKKVSDFDGSISAEHGVGFTKRPFLGLSKSEAEITLIRKMKALFDPDQIINPGKVV